MFKSPKKAKYEIVASCLNCCQTTSTIFEAYEEEYVRLLEKNDSYHEAEKAKLREVIDCLKKQLEESN